MSKGEQTRREIIDHAFSLAAEIGLEGVSLAVLAGNAGLSKSGLFAHFKSKEALQLAVVEEARERFTAIVIRPALREPRGEPRLRALFARFMLWRASQKPPGCIFQSLSQEYDDRPGPVRSRLVEIQREWLDAVRRVVQAGVEQGDLRADLDPGLFAFEFQGVLMAHQYLGKLLDDPDAPALAEAAFESLLARSRSHAARRH
jgi:AcrR family transcriptional regulator